MASLEELADHPGIVIATYLLVFVPWTAVSSIDFISAHWKTVRDCRHDAQYHLFFAVAPTLLIIFYIYLQINSGDYKEMAAAIVALMFSLLDVVRTAWAIAQLAQFRRWTAQAICALREHDIHFKPLTKLHCNDPMEIADFLLVNEEVIDNRLLNGNPRCYLKFGQIKLYSELDPHLHGPKRIVKHLASKLYNMLLILSLPFQMLSQLTGKHFSKDHINNPRKIRQVPHEPISLWLTWATVFVAQGLSEWVEDFSIDSTGEADIDSIGVKEHFENRRKCFIGEVLASAVIHSQPTVNILGKINAYPNVFSLVAQDGASSTFNGRLTKQELLREALCDGRALPFKADHAHALVVDKSGDSKRYGYDSFKVKLQRVTEGMPDKFGISILDFDIERLEWLAILLHLGKNSIEQKRKYCSDDIAESTDSKVVGSDLSNESNRESELTDKSEDNCYRNLLRQLGLGTIKKGDGDGALATGTYSLHNLSAFPLQSRLFNVASSSNRLSLKCSEYIDCWLSLSSGDDVGFLQRNDAVWSGTFDPNIAPGWVAQQKSFHESHPSVFEFSKELERHRLDFQFARLKHRHQHLDTSLTFMGYSMETTRSALAKFIEGRGWQASANLWNVPRGSANVIADTTLEGNLIHIGQFSRALSIGLHESDTSSNVSVSWLKVCILKELQDLCYETFSHWQSHGQTGEKLLLVALAVLSFPSVEFSLSESGADSNSRIVVSTADQQHSIAIDVDPYSKRRRIIGTVVAPGAPQDVFVVFFVDVVHDKKIEAKVRLSVRSSSIHEDIQFNWQKWRDAFQGILVGKEVWQSSHGFPSNSVHVTHKDISSEITSIRSPFSGTGESFRSWEGWAPFRPEIVIFELKSPNFLLQRQKSQTFFLEHYTWTDNTMSTEEFAQESHETVEYDEARPDVLRHGCLTIGERLFHPLTQSEGEAHWENSALLLTEAEKLLLHPDAGVERAIFLLEVGATEYGFVTALQRCIQLLLHENKSVRQVKRATMVVMKYLTLIERKPCVSFEQIEARDKELEAVVPIFEQLLNLDKLSGNVLPYFVSFVRLIPTFWIANEKQDQLRCDIRRAFMYCLDLKLITNLAQIAFIKQRCWEKTDRVGDYVKTLKNRFYHDIHKIMIRKAREYYPWKEETGMRLKRLYLERAVGESSKPDSVSLTSLAHILREGQNGIERDWKRADEMYKLALSHQFRPDSVYFRGVMAKDGGFGLEQDIDRSIEFFEESSVAGYEDRPQVAKTLVKLQRGDYIGAQVQDAVDRMITIAERSQSTMVINNVARVLLFGVFNARRDMRKAKELYLKSMKLGDVDAMYMLFDTFSDDIAQDVLTATTLASRSVVEKQDFNAMNRLGILIQSHSRVEKDFELALELFGMCIKSGNLQAARNFIFILNSKHHPEAVRDAPKAIAVGRGLLEQNDSSETRKILGIALLGSDDAENKKEGLAMLEALPDDMDNIDHLALLAHHYNHSTSEADRIRAHRLYEHLLSEMEVIEPILSTASVDGGFTQLTIWHGENKDTLPISWEKIKYLWEGATGSTQYYFLALLNVTRNYKEGGRGIEKDEEKALAIWMKLISFVKWYSDSAKYILCRTVLNDELDLTDLPVDVKFIQKIGYEAALSCTNDSQKFTIALDLLGRKAEVDPDLERGIALLESIITSAHEPFSNEQNVTCLELGKIFIEGQYGVEPNIQRGIEVMRKAINFGKSQNCMNELGLYYLHGSHGIEKDYSKAQPLFELSIATNETAQTTELAMVFLLNSLEPFTTNNLENQKRVVDIFEKHLSMFPLGSVHSIMFRRYLAYLILLGRGVSEIDELRVVKLLEEVISAPKSPSTDSSIVACKEALCALLLIAPGKIERNEALSTQLYEEVRKGRPEEPISIFIAQELVPVFDLNSEIRSRWRIVTETEESSDSSKSASGSTSTPRAVGIEILRIASDVLEEEKEASEKDIAPG